MTFGFIELSLDPILSITITMSEDMDINESVPPEASFDSSGFIEKILAMKEPPVIPKCPSHLRGHCIMMIPYETSYVDKSSTKKQSDDQ